MRALLTASLLGLAACQPGPVATGAVDASMSAAHERADTTEQTPTPVEREGFIAVVSSRFEVDVATKVGGRLVSLPVSLGEAVQEGDAVALLDDPDLRLAAEAAASNVRVARAELAGARHTRKYSREQLQQSVELGGYVAANERSRHRHELDRAAALAKVAVGEVDSSRVEAERLHTRLDALTLRAPFAAEVAAVYQSPGQLVAPGAPIVRLVSVDRIVRFAVDADRSLDFEIGTTIELSSNGRTTWPGTVTAVAPEIDSAQMVLVEAVLDAASGELPAIGSTGRVRLATAR